MFRTKIKTPIRLNFELVSLSSFSENLNSFSVRKMNERILKNILQTIVKTLHKRKKRKIQVRFASRRRQDHPRYAQERKQYRT